ncbi:MAG: hypothetical protein NTV81_01810 [Candidatus Komeilibacteria bacterium]|nr:hypothetical protein [Candidatus Komeilibacteria bacterium]
MVEVVEVVIELGRKELEEVGTIGSVDEGMIVGAGATGLTISKLPPSS